ncbi:MAG TPA: LLM class flavin-dependent oxidoreductase [Polyangiaceae bacterium]|nr:LLM class flavin-dependent oxidoreductase [Polyangiaceae bacterium]
MARPFKLRTGIFLAPFHPLDEDPTEALHRDLELVEYLDRIGYDEAWIGEHHSGGFEIIASPELFIAAAAMRTKRIKLGTGVVSLPYHNPLMVADRIIQLDHMTRGRVMFGVGPGLLPSDAFMLGIDPRTQRDRMLQALDVILRLMRGETVTEKTDWYELKSARCQLLPYTHPTPEIAVASSVTPSGGRAAGKYGLGMLCVAATASAGFDALEANWRIACELAERRGARMDPERLRLVGPMHLAATREKARTNVREGLLKWAEYFLKVNPLMRDLDLTAEGDLADKLVASGRAVIGTPDDAIAQIERLEAKQGHFGAFLHMAHNWAPFDATKESYELFARHVLPRFNASNAARVASLDWVDAKGNDLINAAATAAMETFQKYAAEPANAEQAKKDH